MLESAFAPLQSRIGWCKDARWPACTALDKAGQITLAQGLGRVEGGWGMWKRGGPLSGEWVETRSSTYA